MHTTTARKPIEIFNRPMILLNVVIGILVLMLAMNLYDTTADYDRDDFDRVCLGGHAYWKASYGKKVALAIQLSDEGLPISCDQSNP